MGTRKHAARTGRDFRYYRYAPLCAHRIHCRHVVTRASKGEMPELLLLFFFSLAQITLQRSVYSPQDLKVCVKYG